MAFCITPVVLKPRVRGLKNDNLTWGEGSSQNIIDHSSVILFLPFIIKDPKEPSL